ncbi:MAG TPA: ATP-binding protein, partial [Tenuifilaceae bacterium]|nr:ATP-binding protein [Tenuifilaceae bacterium]
IQNEETTRRIVGLEYEYRYEKERIEQRRREAEQLAKYERQRYYTITLIIGVTLMVVLVFIVLRNFRRKQRDLKVISEQKKEIEQKNFMLEQQQEEIKSQNENLQRWNNEVSAQNEKINHQKKMLEEQAEKLKEVDELKSRFFTNISHEFRTPLTLIVGPVERMLQRAANNNDISDLRLIHRNAQNLLELINQLLYISRIEKGSVKLKFTKGDICKEISFIVEMFKSHAEGKGLEMKFISCAEAIPAFFDREKLEWILFNLISNAIKNTDSGSITVSLLPENPNTVKVTIADTGKGIEPEKLPYIFDRFYMTEEGGKMGSGIGLAFTNELVNVYKGTINVVSEFGKGTTFTLTLPIATEVFAEHEFDSFDATEQKTLMPEWQTETKPLAEPQEIAETKTKHSQAETILLVEDHDDLRHFIASSLSDKYRIVEAINGKVGIELALKKMPDLIVTDVMMPEVDGIELTKTLKTTSETSHIPIVMLTAKA